jgi:hypothetical protein
VNVAVVPLMVPVPMVVPLSLKVTVPVRPLWIVAVKVTVLPNAIGFREEANVKVGVGSCTTCVSAAEVTGL